MIYVVLGFFGGPKHDVKGSGNVGREEMEEYLPVLPIGVNGPIYTVKM
jgi:hypothetical protein